MIHLLEVTVDDYSDLILERLVALHHQKKSIRDALPQVWKLMELSKINIRKAFACLSWLLAHGCPVMTSTKDSSRTSGCCL